MSTPRLMDQVRNTLRVHRYSLRADQPYVQMGNMVNNDTSCARRCKPTTHDGKKMMGFVD
mgnify:CR=1 FL=1